MIDLISEYRVLRSAAGYYVGEEYFEAEFNAWLPYDRTSIGYYDSASSAMGELHGHILDSVEDDAEAEAVRAYLLNTLDGLLELRVAAALSALEPGAPF